MEGLRDGGREGGGDVRTTSRISGSGGHEDSDAIGRALAIQWVCDDAIVENRLFRPVFFAIFFLFFFFSPLSLIYVF